MTVVLVAVLHFCRIKLSLTKTSLGYVGAKKILKGKNVLHHSKEYIKHVESERQVLGFTKLIYLERNSVYAPFHTCQRGLMPS